MRPTIAVAFVIACGTPPPGDRPATTAAAPGDCANCHEAIAAEWAGSRHAVAYTNDLFQAEFASRRPAWCVTCHAPLVAQPQSVRDDDPLAQRGVDCVVCHGRRGHLVSSSRSPDSPHDTVVTRDFGTSSFCAGCHEFRFPIIDHNGAVSGETAEPMQETAAQFAGSRYAARGFECITCHDDHRFAGSHDLDMLRRAVLVTTCRRASELEVQVVNRRAGHNVPTGGVHRHMVVWAWQSSTPQRLAEAFIGRRFEPNANGKGKRKVLDSTIPPGGTARLVLTAPKPGELINVALRYVYTKDDSAKTNAEAPHSVDIAQRRVDFSRQPRCRD